MQFVYPNFLWALLLVAVPIIIHLFYFRRYKKVLFSNVAFLNEVKDERATKNKLKHLLVLLTRILAIVFLVFAFAQPYFSTDKKKQGAAKNISIYIDNSFSMNAEGNAQLLIDEAKETAKEIILSQAKNDVSSAYKYQILTNDFEGKHQRLVNKTEALGMLKDVRVSASNRSYQSVYERQRTVFKNNTASKEVYQVSDYQSNNQLFENDTSITTNIVKLNLSELRNIYIDSAWFSNGVQLKDVSNKMLVRFVNESGEEVEGNYQLTLNGEVKTLGTYKIPKNNYVLDTLVFQIPQSGWNTGKLQISDYPIVFDDAYFFSFFVEDVVRVLNISDTETDDIFKAVFKDISNIEYRANKYSLVDFNKLPENHFIILDRIKTIPSGLAQSIKKYVENGGNIFIVPNKDASLVSYNTLLSSLGIGNFTGYNDTKRNVSDLNLKHYVLNDLFEKTPNKIKLPVTSKNYNLRTSTSSNEEQILNYRNKDAFLSSFDAKNGNIYVLTSPLETAYSDFKANALFAPILYKMAILSVNNSNLAFDINANTEIIVSKNINEQTLKPEDVIKIKSTDNSNKQNELIPQKNTFGGLLRLNMPNAKLNAGIYEVFTSKNGMNKQELAKVALNYNRKESNLAYYSLEALQKKYKDANVNIFSGNINSIKEKIINNKDGNQLWKWFIIFSLLFLAFEIILLRILK